MPRRLGRALLTTAISAAALVLVARMVDWQEAFRILSRDFAPAHLVPFAAITLAFVLACAWRWWLLLDRGPRPGLALSSVVLSLGGNMLLPARGGDLLRVHYVHTQDGSPHAVVLSRVGIEKFIDLFAVAAAGLAAAAWQAGPSNAVAAQWVGAVSAIALAGLLAAALLLRQLAPTMLRWTRPAFAVIGKGAFFDRHVVRLVTDASSALSVRRLALPVVVTLAAWLLGYAVLYMTVARMVGIPLGYGDALFVVVAGALGLMIPAAPSGIGTFHASVASAFLVMGRSPTEGVVLATAIHLLLFVSLSVPAAVVLWRWRHHHVAPTA